MKANSSYNLKIVLAFFAKHNLPPAVAEYEFLPDRKFRFDFAFVEHKIALEVEGGVWKQGRHNRPEGFLKDIEKYNAAVVEGWKVLRCVPNELTSIKTIEMLKSALQDKKSDVRNEPCQQALTDAYRGLKRIVGNLEKQLNHPADSGNS